MTEIEELKAQIKVLQSKLSFLEELEKTKSPVEEAYKDWCGEYPSGTSSNASQWVTFQAGYNAAYEEKVAQEPEEELKTLYQMFESEGAYGQIYFDDALKVVKEWMSQYTHNVMTGEYLKGYEECLTVLEENLK